MPLGTADSDARTRERAVLSAAASVVTTSAWSRRTLLELYSLPGDRVHVAEPGVDPAGPAPGREAGDALLCVAAVLPHKGQDVLLDALADFPGAILFVSHDRHFVDTLATRRIEMGAGAAIMGEL
jgi:hypothetical protein